MRPATPAELEEARLHQLLHRGNDRDVSFYLRACEGAERVLELGCGSGRVLVELARAGHLVTGLDDHHGMLAAARNRVERCPEELRERVSLVEGCMSRFELGRRFDRVIIPYNGLLCLLDDASLRGCFAAVRGHLRSCGELWFDVYGPPEVDAEEALHIARESGEESHHLVTLYDGDARIEVHERDAWDPRTQRVDACYRFRIEEPGAEMREVEHSIPQRYLFEPQLEGSLRAEGFEILGRWGDFDQGILHDDADHILMRAALRGRGS